MIFYYKFIALKVTALPYSRVDQIRSLFFVLYGDGCGGVPSHVWAWGSAGFLFWAVLRLPLGWVA